jgi:hypothetical protein
VILTLKISCTTDPLVHHGRHFGRTVHALCNVTALLNNGLLYIGELSGQPEETFTHEYVLRISTWMFDQYTYQGTTRTSNLPVSAPNDTGARGTIGRGLRRKCLARCRACMVFYWQFMRVCWHDGYIQIQKGASSARSDDTKSLKGAILDWITPRGQSLNPPLARNIKSDRGFHHERTGALLCPAGFDWSEVE